MGADHFASPDIDKMLEEARSTTDEAKRAQLYDTIQKQLVGDAVELYLWTRLQGYPHRKEVQGYAFCPVMGSEIWWPGISLGTA
jgi:peptide/nickel transport system substrate-binding protein